MMLRREAGVTVVQHEAPDACPSLFGGSHGNGQEELAMACARIPFRSHNGRDLVLIDDVWCQSIMSLELEA